MKTKYGILIAAVALLALVGVALQVTPSRKHRYKAEAQMLAKPFTNAVFGPSFESNVVSTMPGVLRLWVTPTFSGIPSPGTPGATNGVAIRVYAIGETQADAQRIAENAAKQICEMVKTNYGLRGQFTGNVGSARRYSYFHDTLQPAVERWFAH